MSQFCHLKSSYYCTEMKLVYLYFVKRSALTVKSDSFCPSSSTARLNSYISVLAPIPVTNPGVNPLSSFVIYHDLGSGLHQIHVIAVPV